MSSAIARMVPTISLSTTAFRARHRALLTLLWLQLPLVLAVTLWTGNGGLDPLGRGAGPADAADAAGAMAGMPEMPGMTGMQHGQSPLHVGILWVSIAVVTGCAALATCLFRRTTRSTTGSPGSTTGSTGSTTGRRIGAVTVSSGLILSAVALVHAGGGLTDLHFHFFVVLALVGLYQDWVAFAVGVVLVASHHLVIGLISPDAVFSDPRAQAAPVLWSLLHAGFVLAMCAAQIAYWRFGAAAAADSEAERTEVEVQGRVLLEQAVDDAARRAAAAAEVAQGELSERERVTARIEEVLAATSGSGARMEQDAGAAMQQISTALQQVIDAAQQASTDLDCARADSAAATTVIGSLEHAIADIASVAQLIKAVADQTNLLALNATIEAARAGDAGRGFGVVADEVKSLAGQTAAATARIEQTVAEVRASAEAAGEAVEAIAGRLSRVMAAQGEVREIVESQNDVVAAARQSLQAAALDVRASVDDVRAGR